jgi:hypothetical protein
MLKIILLAVAYSTAFANLDPFPDEIPFWPDFDHSSYLTGPADLGEIWGFDSSENPPPGLFPDNLATYDESPSSNPEFFTDELTKNDHGLPAGLGSGSGPFDIIDRFGFNNLASAPALFPVPDCGPNLLLCCSGAPFGAGLYSECSRCMFSESHGC